MKRGRILFIDDETVIRERLSRAIARKGYQVDTASNGNAALELFQSAIYPVVVTDLRMPRGDGLQLLERVKQLHPVTQVIILTGHGGKEDAVRALKLQAFSFIDKGSSATIPALIKDIGKAFIRYAREFGSISPDLLAKTLDRLDISSVDDLAEREVQKSYEELLKNAPESLETLKEAGGLHYRKKDYRQAGECFEKAGQLQPDDCMVHYYLGNTCLQTGEYERAIASLHEALKLDKRYAEAHYSLGVAYGRQGRYREAIRAFEKALEIKPDYVEALRSIGVAYGEIKEYHAAIKFFTQASDLKQDDMKSLLGLVSMALIYREMEKYPEAVAQLEKALKISSDDALVHMLLGTTYQEQGDIENSKRNFIKAFSTDPEFAFDIYQIQKNKADALHDAELKAQARLESRNHLLSYLTHTFRNTMSGGSQTIEQIFRLIQSYLGEAYQEKELYRAVNNIASIQVIFNSLSDMLDTYKLLISEPENFSQKWREDRGGKVEREYLLGLVLQKTLTRLCFEEQHIDQFNRLIEKKGTSTIKKIRQSFLNTVLMGDSDAENFARVTSWLTEYFPVLQAAAEGEPVYFNVKQVRFNFFFAILSEIVYNALKYSDGENAIRLEWKSKDGNSVVQCTNTFSDASTSRSGAKKGLEFINGLTKLVDGTKMSFSSQDSSFSVRIDTK
ncbi:MAG: tetratricopeptide repeat protein [Gammaproteobacteria bacterium]|nr:tetratricopeptide repeat protein [Gammaproteobacteria bacterium]